MQRKLNSTLIALVCVVGVNACSTVSDGSSSFVEVSKNSGVLDPQGMIVTAQALMQEQRYDQARESFARILTVLPENEDAQAGLAYAARLSGDAGQALEHYRQLEKYPSRRTEALEGQGVSLVRLQRWSEAEDVLHTAIEFNRDSWQVWNALGQVKDQQEEWSEAEMAYHNAISLRPLAASLYNNLGVSYLLQLRIDEAIDQFDRSLSLKGGVETVEGNRVVALAMKGNYEQALGNIPWSARKYGLNNIGFAAMLNGDSAKARRFLEMAEEESTRFYKKAAENKKMLN